MTLHLGLILIIITALSAGQFYFELKETSASLPNTKLSKEAGHYAPIPLYSNSNVRLNDDVEVTPPPWSGSSTWLDNRDAARKIMQTSPTARENTPTPSNQNTFDSHRRRDSATRMPPTSPVYHRRQSSVTAMRPSRGSTSSLAGVGRGSLTPTNGGVLKKALFQIGSGDESLTTSESD